MPEHEVAFLPKNEILSFEEIERFVRIVAPLGIRKIRLTGGEPLLRRNMHVLVRNLAAIPGIEDLAMTTNAVFLAEQAPALYDAGLRRINVHLDTLDRARFQHITRRDDLPKVMAGIEACLKDLVEPDIVPLAAFGRRHGIEIRYIEFMPLDSQGLWLRDKVLLQSDMVRMLEEGVGPLETIPDADPRAPATEFRFKEGGGRVGFISSVSHPFCLNCNRLRLTAEGKLRYCLFAIEETDVKAALRGGSPEVDVVETLRGVVQRKWLGHEINSAKFVAPPRPMYSIGG
jgi:cyclic pyranopterin phosphate synthase